MAVGGVAGFWSYSHDDDQRDGHRLVRLARHIQDEFALVTGETLTLFVDRNDISWGEEWRRRIATALSETTFFIPAITPLYFNRPECRQELLAFVGQAQSLDAIELVLPILYVDVPGLTEDSADEARALISRMHYIDWREMRLRAEDSAEYRQAVNSLALRLADISRQYEHAESQVSTLEPDEIGEEGILDNIVAIEEKLPLWQECMDQAKIIRKQLEAVGTEYQERLRRVDRRGATGPLLSTLRAFAQEIDPLARRMIESSKSYSAIVIELDPLILKTLRDLDTFPEVLDRVNIALSPIKEAMGEMEVDQSEEKRYQINFQLARKYAGMSKDLKRVMRFIELSNRYSDDADTLVTNWDREIANASTSHAQSLPTVSQQE